MANLDFRTVSASLRHNFDASAFVMTLHQDCKRRNYCLIGCENLLFALKNVESLGADSNIPYPVAHADPEIQTYKKAKDE